MEAQNIFTIETLNSEQTNALLAFVKTLKVKFKVVSAEKSDSTAFGIADDVDEEEEPKATVLNTIKVGLNEVKLFKKGKLKTTSAKDFLNEI